MSGRGAAGAGEGTRTPGLRLTRTLLYQLSYSGPGVAESTSRLPGVPVIGSLLELPGALADL